MVEMALGVKVNPAVQPCGDVPGIRSGQMKMLTQRGHLGRDVASLLDHAKKEENRTTTANHLIGAMAMVFLIKERFRVMIKPVRLPSKYLNDSVTPKISETCHEAQSYEIRGYAFIPRTMNSDCPSYRHDMLCILIPKIVTISTTYHMCKQPKQTISYKGSLH